MKRKDTIEISPCDMWTAVRTPWSKVFSGFCGALPLFFLFLGFILLIMALIHANMYTSSVFNDPNIVCAPFSFITWTIVLPIMLVLWFLILFCIFWFCYGRELACMDICVTFGIRINDACIGLIIGISLFVILLPVVDEVDEAGAIIKVDNNSNLMFQYLSDHGRGLVAYPIFLLHGDINNIYANSTCDFVPFSDLCPVFGPLRDTINLPGAFKCQTNNNIEDSLIPLLLHLRPLRGFYRTAIYLCIAFAIFFAIGHTLLMNRRLPPPGKWVEN